MGSLMLAIAEDQGSAPPPVVIPYSNLELAEMLGVHRNSVNNALAALKRSRCIDKKNFGLMILDLEKLADISRGISIQGGND
jgi:DNA-binding transcriptional regulator YhcF (GntR family)